MRQELLYKSCYVLDNKLFSFLRWWFQVDWAILCRLFGRFSSATSNSLLISHFNTSSCLVSITRGVNFGPFIPHSTIYAPMPPHKQSQHGRRRWRKWTKRRLGSKKTESTSREITTNGRDTIEKRSYINYPSLSNVWCLPLYVAHAILWLAGNKTQDNSNCSKDRFMVSSSFNPLNKVLAVSFARWFGSYLFCYHSIHVALLVCVCFFSCGKFMAKAAEEQIQTFGQSASIERSQRKYFSIYLLLTHTSIIPIKW